MCCFESLKRTVPFTITFALGLFLASAFYSFTNSSAESNEHQNKRVVKISSSEKKMCNFEKRMEEDFELEFETTVFPPTPPKTLILVEELEKPAEK